MSCVIMIGLYLLYKVVRRYKHVSSCQDVMVPQPVLVFGYQQYSYCLLFNDERMPLHYHLSSIFYYLNLMLPCLDLLKFI